MNFFQRLSYLKKWHDDNHVLYVDNRKIHKDAFSKKYKNELKRYTAESKQLKRKFAYDIAKERLISYQDWVENHFQKLLKKLSLTIVGYQKQELLENFENWVEDFATLDYKFRIYTLELHYKVELARFNSQFDSYIIALREGHADWLFSEDERYMHWQDNHPLYKEFQELEYQYDSLEDDDTIGQNFSFNKSAISKKNIKKYRKMFNPATTESLTIAIEKPSSVKPHAPYYF